MKRIESRDWLFLISRVSLQSVPYLPTYFNLILVAQPSIKLNAGIHSYRENSSFYFHSKLSKLVWVVFGLHCD